MELKEFLKPTKNKIIITIAAFVLVLISGYFRMLAEELSEGEVYIERLIAGVGAMEQTFAWVNGSTAA